eukprot:5861815-Prymnesium_polylepis.1
MSEPVERRGGGPLARAPSCLRRASAASKRCRSATILEMMYCALVLYVLKISVERRRPAGSEGSVGSAAEDEAAAEPLVGLATCADDAGANADADGPLVSARRAAV